MELSNIQEEIFKSVEMIVNKAIENQKLTTTVYGTVIGVKKKDTSTRRDSTMTSSSRISKNKSQYVVKINGTNYTVSDITGFQPSIGDNVWVIVPSGDYTRSYIIGCTGSKNSIYQYLNGSAGIATSNNGVVTLKTGLVETDGILMNSTDDDISLAKVASTGAATDIPIEGIHDRNNVQEGVTTLNSDINTLNGNINTVSNNLSTLTAKVNRIPITYVQQSNPYSSMKTGDIWVGPN